MINKIKYMVMFALLLCLTAPGRADGPTRPATQAEKDYSLSTMTALSRALPKPLPGFESRDAARIAPFDRVTPGSEAEPLRVDYSVTWVNPAQSEKERTQEGEAINRAASRINTPSMQEQQKEIMARFNKLTPELQKAIEKKDQAEVARVQKEMEKVGQELEKLGKAQQAVLKGETGALTQLSSLTIRMSANHFHETQPARLAKELKPVAGNAAYAYSDPEGKHTGRRVVMVGPWKRKTGNEQVVYEAAKAKLPHTRVQTVMVTVAGDPSLTQKVLEGVNWKALQALIR